MMFLKRQKERVRRREGGRKEGREKLSGHVHIFLFLCLWKEHFLPLNSWSFWKYPGLWWRVLICLYFSIRNGLKRLFEYTDIYPIIIFNSTISLLLDVCTIIHFEMHCILFLTHCMTACHEYWKPQSGSRDRSMGIRPILSLSLLWSYWAQTLWAFSVPPLSPFLPRQGPPRSAVFITVRGDGNAVAGWSADTRWNTVHMGCAFLNGPDILSDIRWEAGCWAPSCRWTLTWIHADRFRFLSLQQESDV